MDKETLISFESATLMLTPATIAPPLYRLTVKGVGEDFGGVRLSRQAELSDGYIVYDVLVRQSGAFGSAPYNVSALVQQQRDAKGVLVRGARNEVKALPWTIGTVVDTDPAGVTEVGNLTTLAGLDAARIIGSSILINPSVLEVTAQAQGFNYTLGIVVSAQEPTQVDYLPYFVTQTQTGPGWPANGGLGPVVPPQQLSQPIYRAGRRGIIVVGANRSLQFNVQAPDLRAHQAL